MDSCEALGQAGRQIETLPSHEPTQQADPNGVLLLTPQATPIFRPISRLGWHDRVVSPFSSSTLFSFSLGLFSLPLSVFTLLFTFSHLTYLSSLTIFAI